MIYEFKPWPISLIKTTETSRLDQRVNDLIKIRENINAAIQFEIDWIYNTVSRRELEGKANEV